MLAIVGRKANHLYCLDSMGQPLAIGLGLAVGLADRPRGERVVVVEGDGSLLMGFSTLATVGHLKPRNLVLVVLDNGVYLATGGQPTAGAIRISPAWRGRAAGPMRATSKAPPTGCVGAQWTMTWTVLLEATPCSRAGFFLRGVPGSRLASAEDGQLLCLRTRPGRTGPRVRGSGVRVVRFRRATRHGCSGGGALSIKP